MKNRKSIIAIVAVCILGIVGTTIAYYTANKTFMNVFRTSDYSVSVTEEFESPNDWVPGTTTPKVVTANNTGGVDAAVRISYTEYWRDSSYNPLPLVDNQNPAQRYAVINHPSEFYSKWIESEENGVTYYYYKFKLAPGESVSSFMDSVRFNEYAYMDMDEECEDDDSTCTLSMAGYAGGEYKLSITIQTAQYDKYKEIWGTNVEIGEQVDLPYYIESGDIDTIGSIVGIGSEKFYVIGQEDSTHVKLLSQWNLNVGDSAKGTATGLQDEDARGYVDSGITNYGSVPYSSSSYWYVAFGSPAYSDTYVFDSNSSIYTYVEDYIDYLNDQGVNVTGRLIKSEEVEELQSVDPLPSWLMQTSFWTGSVPSLYSPVLVTINASSGKTTCPNNNTPYQYGVRPVIILEK